MPQTDSNAPADPHAPGDSPTPGYPNTPEYPHAPGCSDVLGNTQAPAAGQPVRLPAVYAYDQVTQAFAAGAGAAIGPVGHLLDRLAEVLDPWQAPVPFLDWLIRITGARVEPDWTEEQRRTAIALAPWLAAHRGRRCALLREAEEIHGWTPDRLQIADPGDVYTGDEKPPPGRMLTVTLTAAPGDPAQYELPLYRLVAAHCPAHLPFHTQVDGGNGQ
ncbi:phage tail protein [Streptomyces sp. NPDC047049]|uniref:phage tail protein n=1 Tax=Streptomyces sp. NPDC047049 TaxID=3156688 RepID=UPI0034063405